MYSKKILIFTVFLCIVAVAGSVTYKYFKTETPDLSQEKQEAAVNDNVTPAEEQNQDDKTGEIDKNDSVIIKKENKKTAIEKSTPAKVYKCNLYNEIPHAALPLSAIAESSELPENIQNELSDIFQNNNVLMMKQKNDKMLIITENTSNIRHNVEFTELSLVTGQQVKTTLGYNDKRRDSDNEIWEYNKETKKPTHHTVFDENGDMIFTEHWNYDSNEPIKYEMKDAGNKIISLRKETLDGDSQLRVEQLVYDKNGNTRISVSATYDGPDVKRFTYYNADKPQDSGSVFSEYENGLKTKETVYTSDLKVLNTYTSDYDDTTRKDITVWDNQNQEVKKLLSK